MITKAKYQTLLKVLSSSFVNRLQINPDYITSQGKNLSKMESIAHKIADFSSLFGTILTPAECLEIAENFKKYQKKWGLLEKKKSTQTGSL